MASSSSNGTWTLFQYGDDPLKHRYVDHESKLAFTMFVSIPFSLTLFD